MCPPISCARNPSPGSAAFASTKRTRRATGRTRRSGSSACRAERPRRESFTSQQSIPTIARIATGCWEAALHGQPYDLEHRIVVDGKVRWVHAKAELMLDDHGELSSGIGTLQDITERRHLEDELRAAEARATGILSVSADAIVSIDDDQRITLFNEGAQRIFGYSRSEAIGMPVSMLIPARFHERHRTYIAAFAKGTFAARRMGERRTAIIGVRKGGEEFPADASISRLEVSGARILTASLRDVSEQKRLETEQRLLVDLGSVLSSSLDYEQTVANVADFAVRELADFCVIDVGKALGGVKAACRDPAKRWACEAVARVAVEASHALEATVARRSVIVPTLAARQLEEFSRDSDELAALHAIEPRSMTVMPLMSRDSLLGAMLLIWSSSSSSRAYEERDRQFVDEIARRAATSIDNATLYRTARRAIRSRDEVLAVVAHDLRNPLNSVMLYNELIAQDAGASVRKSVGAIDRASKRMKRLIEDLLEVTRLEGGQLALDRKPVPTPPLIHDVASTQRQLASAAGLELAVDLASDPPDVVADRDRLTQILENLIGNAIKFTPAGRITLGAAAHGDDVLFWVADSGTGIAPADQPHVFDRFWQGHEARRCGSGLGLAIVKGLVDAHGGRVWVESTEGRGTTFFFTIPAARS